MVVVVVVGTLVGRVDREIAASAAELPSETVQPEVVVMEPGTQNEISGVLVVWEDLPVGVHRSSDVEGKMRVARRDPEEELEGTAVADAAGEVADSMAARNLVVAVVGTAQRSEEAFVVEHLEEADKEAPT